MVVDICCDDELVVFIVLVLCRLLVMPIYCNYSVFVIYSVIDDCYLFIVIVVLIYLLIVVIDRCDYSIGHYLMVTSNCWHCWLFVVVDPLRCSFGNHLLLIVYILMLLVFDAVVVVIPLIFPNPIRDLPTLFSDVDPVIDPHLLLMSGVTLLLSTLFPRFDCWFRPTIDLFHCCYVVVTIFTHVTFDWLLCCCFVHFVPYVTFFFVVYIYLFRCCPFRCSYTIIQFWPHLLRCYFDLMCCCCWPNLTLLFTFDLFPHSRLLLIS